MRSLPRFRRWTGWVRASQVLRRTFDQLDDGVHAGRYSVDHLFKTEKTNFATLIEIDLQRDFRLCRATKWIANTRKPGPGCSRWST